MVEFGCCNHFRPSGDKKEVGSLVGTLKIEATLKFSNFGWLFVKSSLPLLFCYKAPTKIQTPQKKKKKNTVQPFFWGTLKPIMGLELLGSPCGAAGGTGTREDLGFQPQFFGDPLQKDHKNAGIWHDMDKPT